MKDDEAVFPENVDALVGHLRDLRLLRREQNANNRDLGVAAR
jgi:hypothetical protein